jgi:hypothetical protein
MAAGFTALRDDNVGTVIKPHPTRAFPAA